MWIIKTIECNNSSGAVTLHHGYEAPAHMYKRSLIKTLQKVFVGKVTGHA